MPRNIPFKGSKKLGEEFDPDITGDGDYDIGDYQSEMDIDYQGGDKIEGSGFDKVANQAQIDEFGTQTTGRLSGKEGTSYSDFIRKASVSKLESMKGMFKGDKEVLNIIDEEISNRAARKTKIPGSPQGISGSNIKESAGSKYYTESEIKKGTAFYKEELATIDKYLTDVEDIDPKVRTALAAEAAELDTQLELEKAMFGQSVEEAEAVASTVRAYTGKEGLGDLDKPVGKSGKTVLEGMTEDVGKKTAEGFVDYTKTQTSSGLTTGRAKSYVRNMEGLFGESTGFMGGVDDVPVEQRLVKKGDTLSTGGKAKKTGIENLKAKMPFTDQQAIKGQEMVREVTRLEKRVKFLEQLSTKMHMRGVSTPESAAEIKGLKADIKNKKSSLTKMRKNFETVAKDVKGQTYIGEIDKGKAFPVNKPTGIGGGSYGYTEEYRSDREKGKPISEKPKKPMTDFTAEFEQQNPRAAASMRGTPDPGSPLGVNKPASNVKATNLGDVTKSKAYVKEYEKRLPQIAKELSAAAGNVVDDISKVDPAILKKAAASAAVIAANFAKRNPTISAGLMLYSGLSKFNKTEEEDYFK